MRKTFFAAGFLAPVLLLGAFHGPTPTRPAKPGAPRYGIPRLAPGQLWVSSVPVGLEVRLAEDPRGKVIGRTPLVVDARQAGSYVTVTIQKKDFGGKVPLQLDLADLTTAKTHSAGIQDEHTGKVEYADCSLTYRIRLPEKQTVIALFQTKHLPLPELERLYPPGSNFRFSDEIVRASLVGRGVSREFIRAGIPLLHRGGKVAVPGKEGWLVLEVTPSGMVEVIDETAERYR
jgi:hypothetical protein